MLLVKKHSVINPAIEDIRDSPQLRLEPAESHLCTLEGKIVQRVLYEEGIVEYWDESKYINGNLLFESIEYSKGIDEPVCIKEYTYSESNKITHCKEMIGDTTSGILYDYDESDRLIREVHYSETEESKRIRYAYSPEFPDCCIWEEHLETAGFPSFVIHRKWEMTDGTVRLTEEYHEFLSQPDDSRVYRFYDSRKKENNVAEEIYNSDGDFLEETRHEYDSKNNLIRLTKHTDEAADCPPFYVEENDYDEAGRLIKTSILDKGNYTYWGFWLYDKQGRVIRSLEKNQIERVLFVYEYEEVPEDFRLF